MKTRISIDNLNREIAERKRTEELLRQSEERLRMAMEVAKVGTWRWDPATNMDTRDASFNRMLGLEPSASTQPIEEFIGFVYPEDRRGVEDAIGKAVRERGQYSAEFRIVRPDGEVCWLSDRGRVICDEAGEVRYMTGAVVDITERKQAEETLRESEERFHIAAETSNDMVYESDMQHSIQWFGKIDEMLGYGPGEFPRTMEAWADSIHPQDRERVMAAVQAYLDERLPYVIEYRIRRKDGAYQWWAARGAATRTPDGHPVRWIGTITDITERKRAEKTLRESEERYKSLFKANIDGILIADPTTKKFRYANPAMCRMLGYSEEELTQMGVADIHPKESLEQVFAEFEALASGAKMTAKDLPCVRKDGQVISVSINAGKVMIDQTKYLLAIFRDITERKQMEEKLREAEERLLAVNALQKLLLPSLPIEQKLKYVTDAVVRILDTDFARIWTIEPGDRCLSGCTHAEVTEGPHVCRFRDKCLHLVASSGRYTHIDGKDHCRVPFGCYKIGLIAAEEQDKFLTNEAATDPRVHNHDWVKELGLVSFAGYRLTHTDGTPLGVLALFSKHPISPEEDALLEGIAHSTSRVIHTSRTEETLRKSEERYKSLFKANFDGILIADPTTKKFRYANPAICRMLGYSEEELTRMGVADIHPKESLEQVSADFETQTSGAKINTELPCVRKDGQVISVSIKASMVTIGQTEYLMGIFRDITERKQAEQRQAELLEQLEKTNQELKDFAYIVSHDLKAPLRGIKTLTNWITTDYADKLDDNGKEQMNLLASRVDRMHNLIDGILQYSRVGRVEEEKVVVNLNELVPEIIDMIAPPENITITIENELPTVECEQTRIMQVFQNLLSNAVKYMDKPQGQIKIGCIEENGFWKFSIADNGPGIEEKYFEKIFQLFQTLAPRDESESTGIGLTIIKKIVEMYGGKTWVQSKVGEGSTFFFTLPKQEMGVKDAKLEASIVG